MKENVSDEIKILREEMMNELKAFIASALQNKQVSDDQIDIRPDRYVTLISLCPFALNLTTQEYGQGRKIKFSKFGEVKKVLYADLIDILMVNESFVEAGYFYIADSDVIRKHGLDEAYSKILQKEKVLEILEGDTDNSVRLVSLYKSVNEKQREMINEIIIEKLMSADEPEKVYDLNILSQFSRISKYDILKKAEESKFYREQPKENVK